MNVTEFTSAFVKGGFRPSLFKIQITNPSNSAGDILLSLTAKTSQLPGQTLNKIEAPYMGRKIPYAGFRTYEDWQVTIMEDEDFKVRNAIEHWMQDINSPEGNIRRFGTSEPNQYKMDADALMLGKDRSRIETISLYRNLSNYSKSN